jgi:hypothetical protein
MMLITEKTPQIDNHKFKLATINPDTESRVYGASERNDDGCSSRLSRGVNSIDSD